MSTKEPGRVAVPEEPYRVNLTEDPWTTLRHVVEAVAIIAAGVWAFYTFIYQEKIKPAQEPAALAVNVAIRGLGHDRYRDYFAMTLHFENTGKTEIDVAADGYNVWGARYALHQVSRTSIEPTVRNYDNSVPIVAQKLIAARVELRDRALGGRVETHIVMEPGAKNDVQGVFAVDRGRYDVIQAQIFAVPIKTSESGKLAVRVITKPDGSFSLVTPKSYLVDDTTTSYVIPR